MASHIEADMLSLHSITDPCDVITNPELRPAWSKYLKIHYKNLHPDAPPYVPFHWLERPRIPYDYGLNVANIVNTYCRTRYYLVYRTDYEVECRSTGLWKRLLGDLGEAWLKFDDIGKQRPGTIKYIYDALVWVREALEKDARGEWVGPWLTKEEKAKLREKDDRLKEKQMKKMNRLYEKEAKKILVTKSVSRRLLERTGLKKCKTVC